MFSVVAISVVAGSLPAVGGARPVAKTQVLKLNTTAFVSRQKVASGRQKLDCYKPERICIP